MGIRNIISAIAVAMTATVTMAHNVEMVAVTDLSVERSDNAVHLSMTVNPAALKLNSNSELKVTPVIYSRDDSAAHNMEFPSMIFSGRNRYYSNLRDGDSEKHTIDGVAFYRAGVDDKVRYNVMLPYESWMQVSEIDFRTEVKGCCGVPQRLKAFSPVIPVALLDYRRRAFVPHFECEAPVYSGPKDRHLDGSAFVNFWVNKTFIDPYYMSNPGELAKIIATIDVVRNDPDSEVTGISIKGFASPEGSYSNNVRLAKGRTESLKEYVSKESGFDAKIFSTDYEPEDWAGLRKFVADSMPMHRTEILEIIDSNLEPDAKNAKLQREYPADYNFLLKNVYPRLRHSDYRVEYRVRDYDNIDTIRMLVKKNPGKLSLREFYVAATSYEPGSEEYNNVFETAVRIYPDDAVANLNAANAVMSRGDYILAERYLEHAGDMPLAKYARGVLAALKGDYGVARNYFAEAKQLGVKPAAEALQQVETLSEHINPVTYINIDKE